MEIQVQGDYDTEKKKKKKKTLRLRQLYEIELLAYSHRLRSVEWVLSTFEASARACITIRKINRMKKRANGIKLRSFCEREFMTRGKQKWK